MDTSHNTFCKNERLYLNRDIQTLFAQGKSFIAYPFRIVYVMREKAIADSPATFILVSVSKKKFKRAVKRNRVKRLIREAFRLNKKQFNAIAAAKDAQLHIAFIYLKNELPDYSEIEKAILKAQVTLSEKLNGRTDEKVNE